VRLLRASLLLPAVLALGLAGCRQDDEIKKDIFTYQDREEIHKRVAIFEREKFVWFVLLSGPEAEVKKQTATFDEFVRSIRFDVKQEKDKESQPITWTQPKDWRKDPPGPPESVRSAGFRIDSKPKELEVTVTKLPIKNYTLLDNIRRWEREVNVPLSEREDEPSANVKLARDKVDGQPVTWVDVTGYAVHTVSKPPGAVAHGKGFMPPLDLKKQQGKGNGNPFTYTVPAGWRKQEIGPKRIAVDIYKIGDERNAIELTLTNLGGTPGTNINRWRDEVGLPKLSDEKAISTAVQMKIAGIDSYYVDVDNPAGPAAANRTLAVIIPMGQTSWFVKMWGPSEIVGQHKNEFKTFVESFQLDAR
jgi:hypothetical protein